VGRFPRVIFPLPEVLSLLVFGLTGLPSPATAQLAIVGIVTDQETSAPLVGVYVVLEARAGDETLVAALTDEFGRFVLAAEVGGTYRLRAERVGLATEITDWFTLDEGATLRRISMAEQAVELEGFSVRVPVRTCRLDPVEAPVVQRWWDEVRKALEATAFVEASDVAGLRFERFEREWSPGLHSLRSERDLPTDSAPSRPFVSQDAKTLSERGFVQGPAGARLFLAPDAAVLFSKTFLADHCFGIKGAGDTEVGAESLSPGHLLLTVEPTRRRPPDIRGVLTVDTLSGELRSFDFEYANPPRDLPRSEAGGHLGFEYLPSGAWIVSEWWVRLPQIQWVGGGISNRGSVSTVAGYLDRGGRVAEVEGRTVAFGAQSARGTLNGTVYDSLNATPLAGARVWIVGSRYSVQTDSDGRFTLVDVPVGQRGLTFRHPELTRRGFPSPVMAVDVREDSSDTLALSIPGFATAVALFCQDSASPLEAILTGTVVRGMGGEPVSLAEVRANWIEPGGAGRMGQSMRTEARTGADGRYFLCELPSGVPVSLAVRTDSVVWREAGTVELPGGRIVVEDLRPGAESRAVVRGTVRSEENGSPLAGAGVWVLDVMGDTVASALADSLGAFRVSVPPGVGYRAVASRVGYLREASTAFTLDGAESLDVRFELIQDLVMKIEGFVVEVEARNRRVARRLLRQYGENETTMGRRWIGVAALDSMPVVGETDPGVAIQSRGMPGVWVDQAQKYGANPILCVRLRPRECAIIILNGMKIDLGTALLLDFRDLEGIAVLSPNNATTFFGTHAGGGAVLLWTRGSGR